MDVTQQFSAFKKALNIQRQSGLDCHNVWGVNFERRRQNFGGVNLNGPRALTALLLYAGACME
jgi:hypothetical protein